MKKLILVLLALLLVAVFAACGDDSDVTTPGNETTTTPQQQDTTGPITTTGPVTTTVDDSTPGTTAEGIDILNNTVDIDYNAIVADYDGQLNAFTFEDFHVNLDYHVALVFRMQETPVGVYEDLFLTLSDTDSENWEPNPDYTWKVTIDGQVIDINRITLTNGVTSGWVRLDLGADFTFDDFEYDENNTHEFDIRIDIYNAEGKVEYYAYLTDPNFNGPYIHTKPAPDEIIADPERPTNVEAIGNNEITPISGPSPSSGEVYTNMFDGSVRTKLCTSDEGDENAIIVRFDMEKTLMGLSFVNGNDNASYIERTLVAFEIYASNDGLTWELVQTFDGNDENGEPIDKSTICANYQERYFGLDEPVTTPYIKIVTNNGDAYQISELLFYTEK